MRKGFLKLPDLIEAVKLLYEHDAGGLRAGKTAAPGKPGFSAVKGGRRKASGKTKRRVREREPYERKKKKGSGKYENREDSSIFVSKTSGDYALKAGYQGAKMQQASLHVPESAGQLIAGVADARPSDASAAAGAKVSYGQFFSQLAEAKGVLNEMLAGVSAESVYVRELDLTTSAEAGNFRYGRDAGMLKIEYNDPVFINNQWTYQRIFIRSEKDGATVYGSTMDKAKAGGLEADVRYDHKFNTVYFDSMNGVRDGNGKAYWEAWVNGEIVEDALDQTTVKKGDVIEWRLANERESGCGGGGIDESLIRPELRSGYKSPLNMGLPYQPRPGQAGYMQPSLSYGMNAMM